MITEKWDDGLSREQRPDDPSQYKLRFYGAIMTYEKGKYTIRSFFTLIDHIKRLANNYDFDLEIVAYRTGTESGSSWNIKGIIPAKLAIPYDLAQVLKGWINIIRGYGLKAYRRYPAVKHRITLIIKPSSRFITQDEFNRCVEEDERRYAQQRASMLTLFLAGGALLTVLGIVAAPASAAAAPTTAATTAAPAVTMAKVGAIAGKVVAAGEVALKVATAVAGISEADKMKQEAEEEQKRLLEEQKRQKELFEKEINPPVGFQLTTPMILLGVGAIALLALGGRKK